jgi:tetratricopeptide (TPR) repeat protein
VTPRRAIPFADPQSALAARYFVEGSRLDDGDERKMEEAAAAYRKALVIDPELVPAIVNLANLHYARDELIEAQALYERAIGLDPDCFEAHFNLGNILHDLGRYDSALAATATPSNSTRGYADAHFYLAVTLEKTGRSPDAKVHWKIYQDLAPGGEWAELAREFLNRAEGSERQRVKRQIFSWLPLNSQLLFSVYPMVAFVTASVRSTRVHRARASWACGGVCSRRTRGTRIRR